MLLSKKIDTCRGVPGQDEFVSQVVKMMALKVVAGLGGGVCVCDKLYIIVKDVLFSSEHDLDFGFAFVSRIGIYCSLDLEFAIGSDVVRWRVLPCLCTLENEHSCSYFSATGGRLCATLARPLPLFRKTS